MMDNDMSIIQLAAFTNGNTACLNFKQYDGDGWVDGAGCLASSWISSMMTPASSGFRPNLLACASKIGRLDSSNTVTVAPIANLERSVLPMGQSGCTEPPERHGSYYGRC